MDNTTTKVGLMRLLMNYRHINKNLVHYFHELLEDNENRVRMDVPYNLMLTNDSEIIDHVFRKNQRNYMISKLTRETVGAELGMGILSLTGDKWLKQRRAIQPGFHRKRLEGLANIMIEQLNLHMDNVLDKYAESGQEVDLLEEFLSLTLKLIVTSLFGADFGKKRSDAFSASISNSLLYAYHQTRTPFLKPWYRISGRHAENERLKGVRNEHVLDFIKSRKKTGEQSDDLLSMLLDIRYEDGSSMDERQILDEVVIMFAAGHETTGTLLSWIFLILNKHPEIEQKILNDIDKKLGDRSPTFGELREMTYLSQVVDETLRLYPPAWYVEREALEDDVINDIPIEKGLIIASSIYSLHRNPKYWENPDTFDPDRFSPENKAKHVQSSYMPFGAGPKLCIGRNVALMEIPLVMMHLLRRYKITFLTKKVNFKAAFTLRPDNKIMVKLEKRKKT